MPTRSASFRPRTPLVLADRAAPFEGERFGRVSERFVGEAPVPICDGQLFSSGVCGDVENDFERCIDSDALVVESKQPTSVAAQNRVALDRWYVSELGAE